jgi:DNA-binding transcriptional regulator YiaG
MAILGSSLRAELVDALGLTALRRDLRRELRTLAREVRAVRTLLHGAILSNGRAAKTETDGPGAPIAASDIRAARQRLGDSRKVFAQRLGVSPGIVFAWESGRSAPRRKAIVARLRRLLRLQGTDARPGSRVNPSRSAC